MTSDICSYGCGLPGKFVKHGRNNMMKLSCSENIQHCPAMRSRQRQKIQASISTMKNEGRYDEIRAKMVKSRKELSEDGITRYQESASKMAKTRREKNSFSTGAQKAANTKKTRLDKDSDLTVEQAAVIKANQTRNHIDESGTSIAQRAARKGIKKRMTTIDPETGLTLYELGEMRAKRLKTYKNTPIFYGSTYEYKWLQTLEGKHGIDWLVCNVSRGPNFRYYDTIKNCWRNYPSDFKIDNVIYEIKSCYYFSKTDHDLQRNIMKLDAALAEGWIVKLVLNHTEYSWLDDRLHLISQYQK